MARCEFCNRPTKARFEYIEAVRALHRRISNQRKEIARLLRVESEFTAMVTAKAHAEYEARRAAQETAEEHPYCGDRPDLGTQCPACGLNRGACMC